MARSRTASISTVIAVVVALAASFPAACLFLSPNAGCPGDCLCHPTPDTCPIGCEPTYDILPDGGGSGRFSCLNPQPVDAAMDANAGALPACPQPDGAAFEASVPEVDLPSGTCSGSGSCTATVQVTGCPGLVNGVTCSCVDGTWVCQTTSTGTTLCVTDAAADAFGSVVQSPQ